MRLFHLPHSARALNIAFTLLLVAGTLLGAGLRLRGASAADTPEPAPQAGSTVYLPLVVAPGKQQPAPTQPAPTQPVPTQPAPTQPVPPQSSGFFVEPEKKSSRPGIAIDPQGGLHMAYRYHVPYAQHPQAVYAYCPPPSAQCADPAKWGRVAFLDRVEEVQIELTPAGKPRLLILMGDADDSLTKLFVYAECDDSCLSETSWSAIGVQTRRDTLGIALDYSIPKRYFELDPQGRPRFVYYDNNYAIEPDHIGGFYLWCDANCTQEGTWYEATFTKQEGYNYESITEPVLKFTRDGRPRVLGMLNPLGNGANGPARFDLYYIACDSACESAESWQRTPVVERGSGYEPSWDLELDPASDNPRAVNYQSGERKLFYHSCDADCLSQGSWKTLDMGVDGTWGVGAELKLDAQGRPRMVFLSSSRGVALMACNAGCDQLASWGDAIVETADDIDKAYPVVRPVTCNNGIWDIYSPTLVFDAADNAHIIYDAAYKARCQYVDPTQPAPPTDVFHEIWHSVRYVTLH